ncbi:hypothetical protein GGH94_004220 [Coemansia aciculifera]|uniref:Large ribosomal subunit protein mL53 n=1 Tax=Coemansia aciculifera TaxID=417176 RepID=A0A9W8INW9_9FUNG|nr:hypothetical protein LPJ71_001011 [Coemansia sp. S17]KAJ2067296.1 hypothetical protein GGH13_005370 [Coemansia sp. S155-1]KAJ2067816.1 hypothetical protein GGI16_009610 [Coemansia sp. S142-1]KAJ2348940.1 hypothetical protein GGH92_002675 [Coemansia sp. RSA 2673]KAJ2862516.1 hypothetical protein GGH94_004220 [Coemansia aciculifera]
MLKQITNVRVSFCPFSRNTTSTKVFLNRVLSKENSTANPSCKIDVVTTNFAKDPSTIDVTFKDGKKFHISSTAKLSGDDIIAQVQKYSKRLSQQEDLQGQ